MRIHAETEAHERLKLRQEIVMQHVQIDRWKSSNLGEFTCPAGHPQAWALIDGAMNLYCPGGKERSCFESLQALLVTIREDVREQEGNQEFTVWQPTEADKKQREKIRQEKSRAVSFARCAAPIVFGDRKTIADLRAASPFPIPQPVRSQWRLVLNHLFEPKDVIWIGEPQETSSLEYSGNFRSVSDWLARPQDCQAYGPQWSPACFKSGTICRRKSQVLHQRYFPVEGDAPLSLSDQATLLLWLAKAFPLVSVTFSGRASLHALFMLPFPAKIDAWHRFKAVLEALEFDLSNFRTAGTTRCPGWFREPDKPDMKEGVWQELLYLNPQPWKQFKQSQRIL